MIFISEIFVDDGSSVVKILLWSSLEERGDIVRSCLEALGICSGSGLISLGKKGLLSDSHPLHVLGSLVVWDLIAGQRREAKLAPFFPDGLSEHSHLGVQLALPV